MTRLGTLKTGFATLAVAAVPFALAASSASAVSPCVAAPPGTGSSAFGPAISCTTITETVNPGNLTLTGPTTSLGGTVTIGADQNSTYTLAALNTGDNTGSGAGWEESISQTQFVGTAGAAQTNSGTLPQNESIAPGAPNEGFTAVGTSTLPVADAVAPDLTTAITADGSAKTVFADAALNTGEGNFTSAPVVTFSVPASTYSGGYTAVAEVDLVSGP